MACRHRAPPVQCDPLVESISFLESNRLLGDSILLASS